jgi:large subunit ribosomal protein L35
VGGATRYPVAPLMPKMKFHSGAKKRFKKTATGKLKARHAFSSHILEEKSPKRKRAFGLDRRGGHRKARAQSPSRKKACPTYVLPKAPVPVDRT